jgi:TolB-like protein/Flp pilus assembly protein TadD
LSCGSAALLLFVTAVPAAAQCPDGSPPPCARPRAVARAPTPAPTSVAVLAFENLSPDSADAYVAEGLTEEIAARLGQVERLVVTSRTTVRRLREAATMSPPELGRTLNVSYLVNGRVRRVGTRLRVSVELLRASTGVQVWTNQLDLSGEDLLGVQENVAQAVGTAIAGRLLPGERASIAARPTRNAAAYDLLLRGNYMLGQRTQQSVAGAIAEYEAALRLDPGFTAARSRIAYGYAQHVNWGWSYSGLPLDSSLARGLSAAAEALRADSTVSDAWMALALLRSFERPRDLAPARVAFERAIALDPRNAEAHSQYGVLLQRMGEHEAGSRATLRAVDIDPLRPVSLRDLGFRAYHERRYTDALRWLDSALVADPTSWFSYADRARARVALGDLAGARFDAEAALRFAPPGSRYWSEVVMALVESRAGDTAAARSRLARAAVDPSVFAGGEAGAPTPRAAYMLAAGFASVGRGDLALEALERARPLAAQLWSYLDAPELDPIRSDARFRRVVEASRPLNTPR